MLTLAGPGEEGDQPPGGERAEGAEQEDPGGQSAGAAEGGRALDLPTWDQELSLVGAPRLVCPCVSQTEPDWLSWEVLALGTAASRGSGSVSSELLLSTSALLASGLTLRCSSQGGLSSESGGLGPGLGYSPSPNPRGSHGLRGHRAGLTSPLHPYHLAVLPSSSMCIPR